MDDIIQKIVNKAQWAFSRSYRCPHFLIYFNELTSLIEKLSPTKFTGHVKRQTHSSAANAAEASKPPVICTVIKKDEFFMIRVFELKKGSKIPLHDYPRMYGIIKVIRGSVKMTIFTRAVKNRDETEIPEEIRRSHPRGSLIPVELHMSENVSVKDRPVEVSPLLGTYCEICAVEGTAVIFEVVAPPYDMNKFRIHYYSVLESKDSNKIWLYEIPVDPEYKCVFGNYKCPEA